MSEVVPDFFIIGAPKAGTTSLWYLLRQHQDVFMPDMKEPWFFSHDDRYEKLGWSWYHNLFAPGAGAIAVGEASSCYCMTRLYPNGLPRLARHAGGARIVYCVRDPYVRIESAWKQCLSTRHPMPRDFQEAVRTYPPILEGSRYGETLRRYLEVYPRSRVHIVLFEEFKRDPASTISKCLEFLEVEPNFMPDGVDEAQNKSIDKRMDTWVFRMLRDSWAWRQRRRLAPAAVRRMLRPTLRRSIPNPVWPPGLRAWVREALDDDTSEFRRLSGLEDQISWKSGAAAGLQPARR